MTSKNKSVVSEPVLSTIMSAVKYTSFISDRCQTVVEKTFKKFGTSIFHHPILYLVSGIVITVLCSLGLLTFTYEDRTIFLVCCSASKRIQNNTPIEIHFFFQILV